MFSILCLGGVWSGSETAPADDAGAARREASARFLQLSTMPTGLLIPLYTYPADIATNPTFNRLIDLKKSYPSVPVCAIVNPASGPGDGPVDPNYVKAIDRLRGAGVYTLAYVSTEYGKRTLDAIRDDIAAWTARYPGVNGVFLDEMTNDVDPAHVAHYEAATAAAHAAGYWPVFANPGAPTPEPYFAAPAADVIVIHEAKTWPIEPDLKGDYFGGYADYPVFTRAALVYSRPQFDADQFRLLRKHTRWLYVTHDEYEPGSATADNPWDDLSRHLERMFEELSRP